MAIIGILYLIFEDFVLADFTWPEKSSSSRADTCLSRSLVGIQIGLILLSMGVTRSSALSLQAKEGLPRGNQIMGFVVLGKSRSGVSCQKYTNRHDSVVASHATGASLATKQPLHAQAPRRLPRVCPYLCDPDDII